MRLELKQQDLMAKALLGKSIEIQKLKSAEVVLLLQWHGIAKKEQPKLIGDKSFLWQGLCCKQPPIFAEWTDVDEAQLKNLRSTDIEIGDTAIGRENKTVQLEMSAVFRKLTAEEQDKYLDKLRKDKKDSNNQSSKLFSFFSVLTKLVLYGICSRI